MVIFLNSHLKTFHFQEKLKICYFVFSCKSWGEKKSRDRYPLTTMMLSMLMLRSCYLYVMHITSAFITGKSKLENKKIMFYKASKLGWDQGQSVKFYSLGGSKAQVSRGHGVL